MGKNINGNQELINIAYKELNSLLINDPCKKSIVKNAVEGNLNGKLNTQYRLEQAEAALELYRLTKVFNYSYDDDLRKSFIMFIWKWMNRQIINLTNEIKERKKGGEDIKIASNSIADTNNPYLAKAKAFVKVMKSLVDRVESIFTINELMMAINEFPGWVTYISDSRYHDSARLQGLYFLVKRIREKTRKE